MYKLYLSNAGGIYVRPNQLPWITTTDTAYLVTRFYADIHAAKAVKTAQIVDTRS
jgi:hypothetical protein